MRLLLLLLITTAITSCIKDDFLVDEVSKELRITNALDTLAKDSSLQLNHIFLNDIGEEEIVIPSWSSSNTTIATITNEGLLTAHELGATTITAEYDGTIASHLLVVDTISSQQVLLRSGTVATTTFYDLSGDFELEEVTPNTLELRLASNYIADNGLPGLYVYLSNNPNSTANALEIGAVSVFSGAHSYTIPNANINDYGHVLYFCKPFNVKVGSGAIN